MNLLLLKSLIHGGLLIYVTVGGTAFFGLLGALLLAKYSPPPVPQGAPELMGGSPRATG